MLAAPGKAVAVVLLAVLQQAVGREGENEVWVGKYSTFYKNLATSGDVWAVGRNDYRQLGINTTGTPSCWSPVVLPPDSNQDISQVAAGAFHTLFMTLDSVFAVGRNNHGQVGVGTTVDAQMPTKIREFEKHPADFTNQQSVAAGYAHSIFKDGFFIYVWGWNAQGQLGLGDKIDKLTPSVSPITSSIASWHVGDVYAGHDFSMFHVVDIEGPYNAGRHKLWVCGNNLGGQLGLGNRRSVLVPAQALDVSFGYTREIPVFAAGNSHMHIQSIALDYLTGTGSNFAGQIGDGTTISRDVQSATTVTEDLSPFPIRTSGGDSSCYSKWENGTVTAGTYCTGDNSFGQIGMGAQANAVHFTEVSKTWADERVVDLTTGSYHSMLVTVYRDGNDTTNRFLYGSGANGYGQLGDCTGTEAANMFQPSHKYGETTNAPTPQEPTPAPATPGPTPSPEQPSPVPSPVPQTTASPTPEVTKAPSSDGTPTPWGTIIGILVAGGVVVAGGFVVEIACILANVDAPEPDAGPEPNAGVELVP